MNIKGFIELDEISPIAIAFGLVGAAAGWWAAREMGFFWRILTILACGFAGFLVTQRMAQNA